MKRKILSFLLVLVMLLTLAPAAFAAEEPDTIVTPYGEVMEIPTVEVPETPAAAAETVHTISNVEDFQKITQTEWYSGDTFVITNDLDLSEIAGTVSQWSGFIRYFYGTLIGEKPDGSIPIISGIPTDCALIYGIIGGTIENLIFDHGNNAAYISLYPVNMDVDTLLTLRNVTTRGNITLTGSDQSNYSPFIYSANDGGLVMDNCINEANISGDNYAAVFQGYYPLYPNATYTFTNCVNKGNIRLSYAGMFFGNDSDMNGRLNEMSLTITGCENDGSIVGTVGADYLAAPITGSFTDGSNAKVVEDALEETGFTGNDRWKVSKIGGSGSIGTVEENNYFTAKIDENGTIVISHAAGQGDVSKYTVSVGATLSLWYEEGHRFYGSAFHTVTEELTGQGTGKYDIESELKVLGFADMNYGDEGEPVAGYETRKSADGTLYYTVDNDVQYGEDFRVYVSDEVHKVDNVDVPVGNGTKPAQLVTVTAYDANGTIICRVNIPV